MKSNTWLANPELGQPNNLVELQIKNKDPHAQATYVSIQTGYMTVEKSPNPHTIISP